MTPESPTRVSVTRVLNVPPQRALDAWLDPETIRRWMFPGDEIVRVAVDARVGGSFSFVVRRNGTEIDHVGEYLELDRPRRLVFTWGVKDEEGSDRVVVDLVAQGTGCELTLTHDLHPDWAEFADRVQAAWSKMLDSLAATLA